MAVRQLVRHHIGVPVLVAPAAKQHTRVVKASPSRVYSTLKLGPSEMEKERGKDRAGKGRAMMALRRCCRCR
jgi:hypothetical protein